jgi:hypothetical protein
LVPTRCFEGSGSSDRCRSQVIAFSFLCCERACDVLPIATRCRLPRRATADARRFRGPVQHCRKRLAQNAAMRRARLKSCVRRLKTVSVRSGLRPVQAHSVGGVLGFRVARAPSGKPKALGVPERRADRGLRDGDSSAVEFLTVARSCAPRDAGIGTKNDARAITATSAMRPLQRTTTEPPTRIAACGRRPQPSGPRTANCWERR